MKLKTAVMVVLGLVGAGRADVKPAAVFSEHMVLQAGMAVPVWGGADSGEEVTVEVAGQKQTARAGADGKWMVKLLAMKATDAAVDMVISGKNKVVIGDVLVGEVWLGSGQSNMEFTVSKKTKTWAGVKDEEKEIAAADYPRIRMFTVKMKLSERVEEDCEGKWEVCSPETVGNFSAVGYFFSRELQKALKVPVGFLNVSYGASTAQCWISKGVLEKEFKPIMDAYGKAVEAWDARAATSPAGTATQARGRNAPRNPRQDQHSPMLLWNAMLHPVMPYGIRGFLWYQGESITGSTSEYSALMAALIKSWREEWGAELPFYFVQLAALDNNSNRPEVREAQAEALKEPNTGMAVTIDIGDKSNVHPKNKQDLGERLARIARARVYGEKIECAGPMMAAISAEGQAVRVKFSHAAGLMARGGEVKGFELAGADGKYVAASARIEGDVVVVTSAEVKEPAAVHYAWNRWPEGASLYNGAGLPAAPFRSKVGE